MRYLLLFTLFYSFSIFQPLQGQSYLKKADKEYQLYAFNLAAKSYLAAIEKEKPDANTYARLADCYRHLNDMEQAEKWYEKALEAKNLPADQVFNYGLVLMALEKYEKARDWFNVYAATQPVTGNQYSENCLFAENRKGDPASFKVLPLLVNTASSEFGPVVFGQDLLFASARTDIKKGEAASSWTGEAQNRLFKLPLANLGSKPVLFHSDLKNAYNEGPLTFSPDNTLVYFTKNNFVDGTRQLASSGIQLSIFVAEIDKNGDWANAKAFPYNTAGNNTGYPSISPDGKALYFASDRPDGFGGFDLYVCYKFGDTWTAPENLGPTVNSKGNEISPFFDGKSLYFSSDWHPGFGGYDVFRAEKSGTSWDKVFHLGTGINSSYDDYGFSFNLSSNQGFLVSNRKGGKGSEDLYEVNKLTGDITIRVQDGASGLSMPGVSVDFSNCTGGGVSTTDASGKVVRQASEGLNCKVIISKEGYKPENIHLETSSTLSQTFDISLKKEGEMYAGEVLDARTKSKIPGVVVKVTNQSTGMTVDMVSDNTGKYLLALSPSTNYLLRYSKAGYIEVNQAIRTGDGKDKSLLGSIELAPIGFRNDPAVDELTEKSTPPPPPPAPKAKSAAVPPASKEPQPPVNTKNTTLKGDGFAVQVASVSATNVSLGSYYDQLGDLGNIYVKQEGSSSKIRVGVYGSRTEANVAMENIRQLGYPGSFVVEDNGPLYGSIPSTAKVVAVPAVVGSTYKIRLAAYSDLKWFDDSQIKNLGSVEKEEKDKWSIMYLSSFGTLTEAQRALEKVKNAGFSEAYIVQDIQGEKVKIN